MKKTLLFLLLSCLGGWRSPALAAQGHEADSLRQLIATAAPDSNRVKLLLTLATTLRSEQPEQALSIDSQAYVLAKKIAYPKGMAKALNGLGIGHYFTSNYSEAIISWREAKGVFEKLGEMRGVASSLSNMGAIYFNQGEYPKAIELYLQALKIAEKEKDSLRIATVWQNIGAIHNEKGDFPRAIEAFQKALPLFLAIRNDEGSGMAYLNIGEAYNGRGNYDQATLNVGKALQYLQFTNYYTTALRTMGDIKMRQNKLEAGLFYLDSAYRLSLSTGDNFELSRTINTIAKAHKDQKDYPNALKYYKQGKELALASAANFELSLATRGLVEVYAALGDYKQAFENQKMYEAVQDSIYTMEADKKSNRLLFSFDLEKKQNEISLLVKDKKIQQIEVEKQKGIRNMFMGGFALVVLFSALVLRQRNKIKREKKNVEKEKARSEALLLNILPEEVAEELKAKGSAEAKLIEYVTVLFTDFKGFTAMSEQLTPKELVSDIHECFSAFDHIMGKYGLEKIKTIGDAYMAAGGLPVPTEAAVKNTVLAALEMQDFISKRKAANDALGKPAFEMRVGIHTGPVVAGIVGIKKFSYDIWGDTVNTASRMESSGEVGKVNLSQSTYELVKDSPDFIFESRGKIVAKGKGGIEMWFVALKV